MKVIKLGGSLLEQPEALSALFSHCNNTMMTLCSCTAAERWYNSG